jgi:thiamine biosynthesis lipoprotein
VGIPVVKQSHLRRWLFYCAALAVSLVLGCADKDGSLELAGGTMGTTWHVTYTPGFQSISSQQVQQGIEDILEAVNRSMSTYRADSEISRFNLSPNDEWFAVSAGFKQVLQAAVEIGELSGGAYDVTVGPVVNLWGFGPNAGEDAVPPASELQAVLAGIGQDKLRFDAQNRQVLKTGKLALDFSSIAKGYGVDQVAQWLASLGVSDYLVEVGGELRLHGKSPRGDPWRIAIEQPDAMTGSVAVAISLGDNALATSGDYRNYFEVGGRRYSHTIDPRTGYPITHDLVSVTVVHSLAMMADAWATAFMVMGAEQAMKVALEQGLAVYFIRRTSGSYSSSHSPQFERYLETSQ